VAVPPGRSRANPGRTGVSRRTRDRVPRMWWCTRASLRWRGVPAAAPGRRSAVTDRPRGCRRGAAGAPPGDDALRGSGRQTSPRGASCSSTSVTYTAALPEVEAAPRAGGTGAAGWGEAVAPSG
jgi:hypothetical protein